MADSRQIVGYSAAIMGAALIVYFLVATPAITGDYYFSPDLQMKNTSNFLISYYPIQTVDHFANFTRSVYYVKIPSTQFLACLSTNKDKFIFDSGLSIINITPYPVIKRENISVDNSTVIVDENGNEIPILSSYEQIHAQTGKTSEINTSSQLEWILVIDTAPSLKDEVWSWGLNLSACGLDIILDQDPIQTACGNLASPNTVYNLSNSTTITAVKTCTNSTNQTNTCANATNAIGDGIVWILNESAGAAYNGTVNITNSSLNNSTTFAFMMNASYNFTVPTQDANLDLLNSSGSWINIANLSNNSFTLINVTGINSTIYASGGIVQARIRQDALGNETNVGPIIDYIAVRATTGGSVSSTGASCFNVTADNVTLDCGGYSITGSNASSTYGVYSTQSNTTVKNCQISNFDVGIYFSSANSGLIQNNSVSSTCNGVRAPSYSSAIFLTGSSSNVINNNNVSSATGRGLLVRTNSNSNSISNLSTTSASGAGIDVSQTANNNNFTNITASLSGAIAVAFEGGVNESLDCQGASLTGDNTSSTYGVYSTQTNTTIANCNISNFMVGINLSAATSANIFNNTINTTYNSTGYGIRLLSSSDNANITNNTIYLSNTGYGISAESGVNASIDCQGASITGSSTSGSYGVYSSQTNTTIKNCIISSFQYGIYAAADNNIFTNNTINSTGGIKAYGASHQIANNTVYSSTGYGIVAYGTSSNYTNNTVSTASSSANGLIVWGGANNTFTNNSFTTRGTYAIWVYSNAYNNQFIGQNVLSGSSSGFAITYGSANNTINCLGASITGSNTTSSYGIYSAQANTTVKNCQISNFSTGIYLLTSAANSSIINNSASTTSSTGRALDIENADNSIIANNNANATTMSACLLLNSTNMTVANNTFNTTSSGASGAIVMNGTTSSRITNNTIYALTSAGIKVNNTSSGINFTRNNITALVWVNDSNGTNNYNSTSVGNIYYFANGTRSWQIFNVTDTNGDHWADVGSDLPFNATTVGGNWSNLGQGWFPYTETPPVCQNLVYYNYTGTNVSTRKLNLTCANVYNRSMNWTLYWYVNGLLDPASFKNGTFTGSDNANYTATINYSHTVNWTDYLPMTAYNYSSNILNSSYAVNNIYGNFAYANNTANMTFNTSNIFNDGIGGYLTSKFFNTSYYCKNSSGSWDSLFNATNSTNDTNIALPTACYNQTPIQIWANMTERSKIYNVGILIARANDVYPLLHVGWVYNATANVTDGYNTTVVG